MHNSSRRTFMLKVVAGTAALQLAQAQAQSGTKVQETDPDAVTLGYKTDTTRVDAKKFPKHSPSERCGVCKAFLGKSGDAWGECSLFDDKVVSANGWCSSFVKKG